MAVSHFAYNMMKISAACCVINVKADVDDTIYCIQMMNQTVAATANARQGMQEADVGAFPGDEGYYRGSASISSKKAPFHGDPQMTKKVALTSDGVRTVTIGSHLADK